MTFTTHFSIQPPATAAHSVHSSSMFAVTLFRSRLEPLCRITTRAASEGAALDIAQRIYSDCLAAIGVGGTNVRTDFHLDPSQVVGDPDLIKVERGVRERSSWRLQYLVRFAGSLAEGDALSKAGALNMLQEVVMNDNDLFRALVNGEMIEPCVYHDWARSSGWVTVDCAFRVTGSNGRPRDVRPQSEAVRSALRLLVLNVTNAGRETIATPIRQRIALGQFHMGSATLRAAHKARGMKPPTALIEWLEGKGINGVAEALAGSRKDLTT